MFSEGSLQERQGCTVLVLGTPASGKSSLISRLILTWLRTHGYLDVSVVSDNVLLKALQHRGTLSAYNSNGDNEFLLTPETRRSIAATTARDVVTESRRGRIAVLELATFEWATVQANLRLPEGRKSYAIYLSCRHEVSLQRQHERAHPGTFNAILPQSVMNRFMQNDLPRRWLADQLDSYWEFDTDDTSLDEIISELGEIVEYGAKLGTVRQLYDSEDAVLKAAMISPDAESC